jgi:hypothetical protein
MLLQAVHDEGYSTGLRFIVDNQRPHRPQRPWATAQHRLFHSLGMCSTFQEGASVLCEVGGVLQTC